MSHAIVRVETPEEREYARYITKLEMHRRHVAELQAEVEMLKLALTRFQAAYHAQVGRLFVDLDRLKLSIDEYERRITSLQTDPTTQPEHVEQEIRHTLRAR